MSATDDKLGGVWVVYDYDHGPYAISIHERIAAAARAAARQGYGKVGFWPFGDDLGDAVKAWEQRSETLPEDGTR